MRKPSERIGEIVNATAVRLAYEQIAKAGSDFLMKIPGQNRDSLIEAYKSHPSTILACILMYLDERWESDGKVKA